MSFSDEVKKELCTYINDKDKRFACLYGMLLFSRILASERICFQSKNKTAADTFGELFGKVFGSIPKFRESTAKNNKIMYIYDITDTELIGKVFERYHFSTYGRHMDTEIVSTGSLGVFTAGVFLACGSVNDPEKEYHLEFTAPEETLAHGLADLLADIGVTSGLTIRRGQYVVYIKGSESIEDTLTFIGAQQCTLELMNVKIYKDVRNKANRITNCDNANINKVVTASMKQVEDIRLIASTMGLDILSEELREVAELRLSSTGLSLQDIGDSLSIPLSRSGVNHRLKKIAKIADEIRAGGGYEKR